MKIKTNQTYTDGVSFYKILAVTGDIVFVSAPDQYESSNSYYSTAEFEASDLVLVDQPVAPKPKKFRALRRLLKNYE